MASTTSTAAMCAFGDAIGETVRAAGVVGDVAADRADLLARRIGRKMKPHRRQLFREVEIDHPGLDPRNPVDRVDLENLCSSS